MENNEPDHLNLWLTFAAFCGSVTSLSLMQWKTMDRREMLMTVFVGFTFSIFIVPPVGAMVFHIDQANIRAMAAAMYFGATGANAFIPMLIKKFTRSQGDVE